MSGSPALKIVRQLKPATSPPRRVERGEIPPNGTPSVGPLPFTMTDAEIARDLRVSPKTIRRMDEAGKIPAPVTVGARSLRWVRQTIVDWLAAGCPDRQTFEALGKGGNSCPAAAPGLCCRTPPLWNVWLGGRRTS